jgi:hypothetical protein
MKKEMHKKESSVEKQMSTRPDVDVDVDEGDIEIDYDED